MKKTILGSLIGAVILFVWSFLAWVVLPLHTSTMRAIPNEGVVANVLSQNITQRGVYLFPHSPGMSADKAAQDAWVERMKRGPNGLVIFDPAGMDPMMPGQMGVGFLLDIVSAFFVVWLLSRSTAAAGSYLSRVTYCGMIGIFVAVFVHLVNWNWMGMPGDYTSAQIIDVIVGWILAGLGIAAVVKSGSGEPSAKPA